MIILRQKEFNARINKKKAKQAAQITTDVASGNMTVEEGNKALGKIQATKGVGKVLKIESPSEKLEQNRSTDGVRQNMAGLKKVTIKPQKNENQARHIAEGLSDGDKLNKQVIQAQISKKSGAKKGYTTDAHVIDVAEREIEPTKKQDNLRKQKYQSHKVKSDSKAQERQKRYEAVEKGRAKVTEEANIRKQQAAQQKVQKAQESAQKQQLQIQNAKRYQAARTKMTQATKPTSTIGNKLGNVWNSKGGKAAIIGGGALATGTAVYGISRARKKRKKAEVEE